MRLAQADIDFVKEKVAKAERLLAEAEGLHREQFYAAAQAKFRAAACVLTTAAERLEP